MPVAFFSEIFSSIYAVSITFIRAQAVVTTQMASRAHAGTLNVLIKEIISRGILNFRSVNVKHQRQLITHPGDPLPGSRRWGLDIQEM